MLRRLLVGLVLGLVVGGLVAAGFVQGLHILTFGEGTGGALFAYASAAVTGVLTGLVAGKPIWASGAKIEAGLKAFFGALLAAGLMFALRQWGGAIPVPTTVFTPAGLHLGDLPATALPLLAAVLGGFFELDNTGGDESDASGASGTKGSKKRVAEGDGAKARARVAADTDDEAAEPAAAPAKRAKR
jgi:hypothetical protein